MVSVDDLETNTKFAKEHEADFPILSDPDKTVANAYGVLNPTGLARRWTFYIGGDGKILYIEKKVAPASAGDDLATKLGELADKGLVKRKK
jgi:peroxiredoxin Q/BCP